MRLGGTGHPAGRSRGAGSARRRRAEFVSPELATLAQRPPDGPLWIHEEKLDGYRIIGVRNAGIVALYTRSGKDWAARYPRIAHAVEGLAVESLVLDGEVVAIDAGGVPSFQRLQRVMDETDPPIVYVGFDLLHLDGRDLRALPLTERRAGLELLLARAPGLGGAIRMVEALDPAAGDPLDQACRRKLEGVVSKRADAPYRSGRTLDWIKSKCGRRQEFIIVGFTEPKGSRSDLGALLLAVKAAGGELRYAGKVGTGFDRRALKTIRRRLEPLRRRTSPFATGRSGLPRDSVHWVRPELVAEVRFTEWTEDGVVRHPAFEGLREDKPAAQVRREETVTTGGTTLTHPDRVLYPEQGITKRDLAEYYERVSELMLPHVAGRPIAVVRCPSGQGKACFYQKHWTGELPAGLGVVSIREEDGSDNPYAVVKDSRGLLSLAQFGALEIHGWQARSDRVESPDRVVFDLDPAPDVPWGSVRAAAERLRALLADLDLSCWIKTSGGKGLHVVLPIDRRATWDVTAAFARAVALRLAREEPDRYLTVASKKLRAGKIFIDWLRNSRGALVVAPWSTRARPGAPISVPIGWDQLPRLRSGDQFTLPDVGRMVAGRFADPWSDLPATRQRITLATAQSLSK